MKRMQVFQRQEKILQMLRQQESVSVAELARQTGVSGWTIRRDLAALEATHQVMRHHGGVRLAEAGGPMRMYEVNAALEIEAKAAIGKQTAQLIKTGQFVALAAGSTTAQVALALHTRQGIALMTNSLSIAQELSREPGIQLTCAGGEVHGDYYTLTGPVTERTLRTHYYDLAISGVSGISLTHGLTVDSQANAACINIMLDNASRRIIVADHTKFDAVSYAFLRDLEAVDLLVTDRQPPAHFREPLHRKGTQVIVAS